MTRRQWPLARLGDLCEISIGKTPARKNSSYWGKGYPWLSIKDMNQGKLLTRTAEEITHKAVIETKPKLRPSGTVLFSFKLSIGKVGITTRPMYTNEAIAAIDPKNSAQLDKRYLIDALEWVSNSIEGSSAVMGKTLNKKTLSLIEIPLPPLEEQRRIAGTLGKASKLQNILSDQIIQLEGLRQGAFQKLLQHTSSYQPLGSIVLSKPSYGLGASACDFDQNLGRYIRITDIDERGGLFEDKKASPSGVETDQRKGRVHPGDLLIARSGATVGKSYLHPLNSPESGLFWYAGYLVRFQVDPSIVDQRVVFDFLHTRQYQSWVSSHSRTVAQPNINAKVYSDQLMVPVPPAESVKEYLVIRETIDQLNSQIKAQFGNFHELQASLSARAFTGEL